jgi:hypothetical protein
MEIAIFADFMGNCPSNTSHQEPRSMIGQFYIRTLTNLNMRLPVLSIYTAFPGDYRSRDEVNPNRLA